MIIGYNKIKCLLIAGVTFLLLISPNMSLQAQSVSEKKAKAYMVADAHLDTQWNWDVQTTIKEYVWNTLSQNLLLLKRYPDYIFNFEGGVKYAWMKEFYPAEFAQLKEYVKEGRWHISGSSWDVNDVLVPSPESTIRNILLGQEYYRREFQTESTDIFLPDCFGFGWTLPTIASHCGLIGFSSQKLDWRVHPFYNGSKHPFTIGLWKGIDGSSIMLSHGYGYGERWNDVDLSENKDLFDLTKRTPLNTVYRYYGTGDVGGSPTIGSVRSVEKGIRGNGPLQIISATSDQLFKDYLPYENHSELPVFDGELLMDVHGTGCYTSQAAMKLYNRQNELLGDAAERAAVGAEWLNRKSYPSTTLSDAWKRFILHQFHADLTGTSIPRAYEFSWNDELISLNQFSHILASSVHGIASELDTRVKGIPVILYNALGFQVNHTVEVEVDMPGSPGGISVFDAKGTKVPSQLLSYNDGKARILVDATVPAVGYAVYDVRISGNKEAASLSILQHNGTYQIENSVYRMSLDSNGDITSLIDKRNNKEIVKQGKAIRLALFTENKSYNWPAWEILKETIDKDPISIGGSSVKVTLTENGKLRKTLCIRKQHGKSVFCQYIHLYEGSQAHRIDFRNEIDWESTNALLKAEFPLNVDNEKATYDLGIGSVMRGNNTQTAYEVYAQYWADLTDNDHSYGVSILNDSKYGWDKPNDHTLRLTLLHTPETAGNYPYQNRQDFGFHSFTYSLIGHAGKLDKTETVQQAEQLNQSLKAFQTQKHKGTLGKDFSFMTSSNPNVLIKALKKAESSDEYVVRVYETGGEKEQQALLTFAGEITGACEADGTEKKIGETPYTGKQLKVTLKPYSVKTFRVKLKPSALPSAKLEYAYLPLNYNLKCSSWNEFRNEANFEAGYSYAAELLPDTIFASQVPFRLGEKDVANGMTCKGDTLQLPAGQMYNRIYFLAAATDGDYAATFRSGKNHQEVMIPCYTGLVGQWGHTGHTEGYLKQAEIAYVGTHRHVSGEDRPYEYTYLFKFGIDIPKGATSLVLPKNEKVVLFAATLVQEDMATVTSASQLFRTANREQNQLQAAAAPKENLLKSARIIAWSGYVNDGEHPKYLIDGDVNTKWCVTTPAPHYVVFDLGEKKSINSWKLINAGQEGHGSITSDCFLQVKNEAGEEWKTIDGVRGNSTNTLNKVLIEPVLARYVRLFVTRPEQNKGGDVVRIYEFGIY